MPRYRILLHPTTLAEAQRYRQDLAAGRQAAGHHLQRQLRDCDVATLTDAAFLERLFATKTPLIFAESQVFGDGRDWNLRELSLLGGLGVAVDVRVFDNGRHVSPDVHAVPLAATLLFIPGALLRNDTGHPPADLAAASGSTGAAALDLAAYTALYERRLLPLLLHTQQVAVRQGCQALVTVPGLGCGQFAGSYQGRLGAWLERALADILQRHSPRLPAIKAVYYDPYHECQNARYTFGSLSFRVRPLLQGNQDKPQLCSPQQYAEPGDDFGECRLFSVVAWDPVSWPGNDFYGGARCTDDGVKAAATDVMHALTGVEGRYDPALSCYRPPDTYRTWGAVVQQTGCSLAVVGRLDVLG